MNSPRSIVDSRGNLSRKLCANGQGDATSKVGRDENANADFKVSVGCMLELQMTAGLAF